MASSAANIASEVKALRRGLPAGPRRDLLDLIKFLAYEVVDLEDMDDDPGTLLYDRLEAAVRTIRGIQKALPKFESTDLAEAKKVKYCSNCGDPAPMSAKKCSNCGDPVFYDRPNWKPGAKVVESSMPRVSSLLEQLRSLTEGFSGSDRRDIADFRRATNAAAAVLRKFPASFAKVADKLKAGEKPTSKELEKAADDVEAAAESAGLDHDDFSWIETLISTLFSLPTNEHKLGRATLTEKEWEPQKLSDMLERVEQLIDDLEDAMSDLASDARTYDEKPTEAEREAYAEIDGSYEELRDLVSDIKKEKNEKKRFDLQGDLQILLNRLYKAARDLNLYRDVVKELKFLKDNVEEAE